jgi:hypothetical protein
MRLDENAANSTNCTPTDRLTQLVLIYRRPGNRHHSTDNPDRERKKKHLRKFILIDIKWPSKTRKP